jgi:mRNA-degrading endonuclease toxin of MazEF toxin-antitoxin module
MTVSIGVADAHSVDSEVSKKPRRQYKKGLDQALSVMLEAARAVQQQQRDGARFVDETSSTHLLGQVVGIQGAVYGVVTTFRLRTQLASYHEQLGNYAGAVAVLEELVSLQQNHLGERNIEVAMTLRQLALACEKCGRGRDALNARGSAERILASLIGDSPALEIYRELVEDSVKADMDFDMAGEPLPSNSAFPRQGEIWWVELRQFPEDPHQPRPCIIVSVDGHNEFSDKVQIVPMTTKIKDRPYLVKINAPNGGLRQDGVAKCNQLTTISKTLLRGPGPVGEPLSEDLVKQVISKVKAGFRY